VKAGKRGFSGIKNSTIQPLTKLAFIPL